MLEMGNLPPPVPLPQPDRTPTVNNMPIYEALAQVFAAEDVDTHFTLMGDGNMHWATAMKNPSPPPQTNSPLASRSTFRNGRR